MADDEGNVGFFAALWRLFTFYKLRKALSIGRAANRQFTSSVPGIVDAYELEKRKYVRQFNEMRDAVSEVEAIMEDKRQRLDELNKEEEKRIRERDGALALAEKAQAAGDADAYVKHEAAFARYDGRINEIEGLQARLEQEIKDTEKIMKGYMLKLTEMQSEIQKLPQEKAQAIADFVSSTKIIELNDRLLGIQTSFEGGPIQAVREANKKLTAKARISEKLAGTDVRLQDAEYALEGRVSTSASRLAEMLAARKAEREGGVKATEAPVAEQQQDRPKI